MLTKLTNLTDSATLTLLTNGTRSLALVVDVNKAQAYAAHSRHRSHLQVGQMLSAGMPRRPISPEPIGIMWRERVPGSPLGGNRLNLGQLQSLSPWTVCSPDSGARTGSTHVFTVSRVSETGRCAGNPARFRTSFATAEAAKAVVPDLLPARAVSKRPVCKGG